MRALELVELVDRAAQACLPELVRRAWLGKQALDLVHEDRLPDDRLGRGVSEADPVFAREIGAPFVLGRLERHPLGSGRARVARGEVLVELRDAAGLVRESEVVGGHHLGAVVQDVGRARQDFPLHERPHVREALATLAGQPVERHEVRPDVGDVGVGQHPGHCTDGPRSGAWHRDMA